MGRDDGDETARAISNAFIQGIAETKVVFTNRDETIRTRGRDIARPVDGAGIDNHSFEVPILLSGQTPEKLRKMFLFIVCADDDGSFRHWRAVEAH